MFDSTYIDGYRAYLTDVRRSSVNTVASYIRDISKFAEFLRADGKKDINKVSRKDISSYLDYLKSKNKSAATISRCASSLKAYFNHLIDAGSLSTNPATDIAVATAPRKPPRILTDVEIKLLLKQPDIKDIKGCRDKAMFEILYATGIRVSELINLNISDINLSTGLVTCRNGKERLVPIHEAAISAVEQYLSFARPRMASDDRYILFVNTNGERLTRQGFWKILKAYSEKAQISGNITPQILRNSFAAHLLENGANIHTLKEILGHSDISSTKVYAQVVKHELKDIYSKAHPMASN